MDNAQIMAEVPVSIRKIAAYRAAETRQRQPSSETSNDAATEPALTEDNPGELATFKFERDLEASLARHLDQLEPGLKLIGTQYSLDGAGILDVLAEDASGALVAIELKAVEVGRDAIGQICGYMGALTIEHPARHVRGVLVAPSFKRDARFAAQVVPDFALRAYGFQFTFRDPNSLST